MAYTPGLFDEETDPVLTQEKKPYKSVTEENPDGSSKTTYFYEPQPPVADPNPTRQAPQQPVSQPKQPVARFTPGLFDEDPQPVVPSEGIKTSDLEKKTSIEIDPKGPSILQRVFDVPAAANREAIRKSPLKALFAPIANILPSSQKTTGAPINALRRAPEELENLQIKPEEENTDPDAWKKNERFQDQAIRESDELVTKAIRAAEDKIGTRFLPEDAETIARFYAGLPGSTVGLALDMYSNPGEVLAGILGDRAIRYVGKAVSWGGRTLGERATQLSLETGEKVGLRIKDSMSDFFSSAEKMLQKDRAHLSRKIGGKNPTAVAPVPQTEAVAPSMKPEVPMAPAEDLELRRSEMVDLVARKLERGGALPEYFKNKPDIIAEAMAKNKRARKLSSRTSSVENNIVNKMLRKEKVDIENIAPEIVHRAKMRVLDQIDSFEESGKLSNYHQDLRYRLRKELNTPDEVVLSADESKLERLATDRRISERLAKEKELENEHQSRLKSHRATHGQETKGEIAIVEGSAKNQAQKEFVQEVSSGGELRGTGKPEPAKYAGSINLENLDTDESVKSLIKETSDLYKGEIDSQRRGTITHEETAKLANDLGLTVDKILKARKGQAYNAEELYAIRSILLKQTEKATALMKKIQAGDNSEETFLSYREALAVQQRIQRVASGGATESGRTQSALRIAAKSDRIAETAAKAVTQKKVQKMTTEELIKKATAGLQNKKGAVGNLGPANEEAKAAQIELFRRAKKQGAATAKQTIDYLVKMGITEADADAIIKSAEKAMTSGAEYVQKKIAMSLEDQDITKEIAKRMSQLNLSDPIAVNKFIRDVGKAKTSDAIYTYFINSILSNPLTHIVNNTANILRSAVNPVYRAVGAAAESPKYVIGKNPEIYLGEAGMEYLGKTQGMKEGARRFIHTMRHGITEEMVSKLDARPAPIKGFSSEAIAAKDGAAAKALEAVRGSAGEIVNTPTKALTAEDEFIKAINSQGEIHALAYRSAKKEGLKGDAFWSRVKELIKNPSSNTMELAQKAAERQSFQDPLGEIGQKFMSFRNKAFDKYGILSARWVAPFVKTPSNLIKEAARTSPLGFLTPTARSGGAEGSMAIGQAAVGTAISLWAAQTALEGKITGAAPSDNDSRARFYMEGKKPYSVLIGDRWVSYARLEPFSTPLGLIADGYRLYNEAGLDDASLSQISVEAAKLVGKNALQKTFMSGMSNLVNAVDDPGRYGTRFITGYASGMIFPAGFLRGISNAVDETVRQPKTVVENIKAGLPWISKQVRPKIDPLGNQVKKSGSGLERFFSPMQTSVESKDKIINELSRLDITIPSIGKKQGGVNLTPDEFMEFSKEKGKRIKNRLEKFINKPNYDQVSDSMKKRIIEKIFDDKSINPEAVSRAAEDRVFMEYSKKISSLGSYEKKYEYLKKLEDRKKISTRLKNRLKNYIIRS